VRVERRKKGEEGATAGDVLVLSRRPIPKVSERMRERGVVQRGTPHKVKEELAGGYSEQRTTHRWYAQKSEGQKRIEIQVKRELCDSKKSSGTVKVKADFFSNLYSLGDRRLTGKSGSGNFNGSQKSFTGAMHLWFREDRIQSRAAKWGGATREGWEKQSSKNRPLHRTGIVGL